MQALDQEPDEIRHALQNILQSKRFKRSGRASELLSYLVIETLAGRTENLKAFAIAVDVFGRDASANPESETLVRVQASRLREMLEAYYNSEGSTEKVRISLPRGGYVPEFEAPETQRDVVAAHGRQSSRSDAWRLAAGGFAIMSAILAILLAGTIWKTAPGNTPPAEDRGGLAVIGFPWSPRIAVMAVAGGNAAKAGSDRSRQLTFQLTHLLARFRAIQTISLHTEPDLNPALAGHRAMIRQLGVNYILQTNLAREGENIRVLAQLVSSENGRLIWSENYLERASSEETNARIELVFAKIVATIASSYGAVAEAELNRMRSGSGAHVKAYKCLLGFFEYAANKSVTAHAQQRDCLEEVVATAPDVSRAWAMLSWIYGDESRYGYNLRADSDPLQRAVTAGTKAVALAPDDAFAQYYLAEALYASRRDKIAAVHFEKALKLNPNDTEILASVAWKRSLEGKWRAAEEYSLRAIALSPKHPNWFRIVPYMVYARKKEYQKALETIETRVIASSPLDYLGRLSARAELGQMAEAKALLEQMDKAFPGYSANVKAEFAKLRLPEEIALIIQSSVDKVRGDRAQR